MELLLKDDLLMTIESNGQCTVKDFDRLPFALRKPEVALIDFIEWASNRTLSIGRSYAKEILNSLRLSQVNRYAVCKACRAVSLEDAYWIRQTDDQAEWEEVNLFKNKLSLFITEVSLSGSNTHYRVEKYSKDTIHTPELTTLGANAKGWIRSEDGLYLHKVGKNELPASEILEALQIKHIPYYESEADEVRMYLSEERRGWIEGVGEKIVKSRLFTTEDQALVTFEEFKLFCNAYGMNPYEEALKIDKQAYLEMQIADYILNNNDRHEQNWGFIMDNESGQLTGYVPLFDHDHAFAEYKNVHSQTTEQDMTLLQAAVKAQGELKMDLSVLDRMEKPKELSDKQWKAVQVRKEQVMRSSM